MRTMVCVGVTLCCALWTIQASAQTAQHGTSPTARAQLWSVYEAGSPALTLGQSDHSGSEDDPAYEIYKKGYSHVLDERWADARKLFGEVLSRFPSSEYCDDAQYWSAYALSHLEWKRAAKEYEKFLRQRPHSRYYDDAVADLAELHVNVPVPPQVLDSLDILISPARASVVLPQIGPDMQRLALTLRHVGKDLRKWRLSVDGKPGADPGPAIRRMVKNAQLDAPTRVRAEALLALTGSKEDRKAYETFEGIARDPAESPTIRIVALRSLSSFTDDDVLPLFLEVARTDHDKEVRTSAIYLIAATASDRNKSLDVLVDLYHRTPRDQTEDLDAILEAVADVGNDKAVNFLVKVARTEDNIEIQSFAIDHIGQLEHHRFKSADVLIDLFHSIPKDRTEPRHTILFSLADIGNDRAVDFLIRVAKSSPDNDLRSDAVYYLGNIGSDKARTALTEILRGK